MKYALVQFQDGQKMKFLVLTKDIKGFQPSSVHDVANKEYLIKWQKSFDGGESEPSNDGCYPGKILLVGGEQLKPIYLPCSQVTGLYYLHNLVWF